MGVAQEANVDDQRSDSTTHLISVLRAAMEQIVACESVVLAYLHGSAANGRATALSDVDIAIVVEDGVSDRQRLALVLRLQRKLSEDHGIDNTDIHVINDASIVFQGKVVTDGILLFARSDVARIAYEERARQRYFDFAPLHLEIQRAYFSDLKERGLYGRS